MLRAYVMSCALTLLACSCLAAMLCLRDAACLGAHFGSRTPYERGSRGSGDPLESFLSVSDAGPARPVEIKKPCCRFRIGLRPQVFPQCA